jgi:hypothetical protein
MLQPGLRFDRSIFSAVSYLHHKSYVDWQADDASPASLRATVRSTPPAYGKRKGNRLLIKTLRIWPHDVS